jgi:hypothetical protein
MRQPPFIVSVLVLVALCITGCQSPDSPLLTKSGIKTTDQNASIATFNHPISRLDYDLWRAAKIDGWAMPFPIEPDDDGHYRGKGQLPDGRPLIVDAWPNSDDKQTFTATVKVGRLGDPAKQNYYLSCLEKILNGKAMPKRGLNFTKDDVVREIPKSESTP